MTLYSDGQAVCLLDTTIVLGARPEPTYEQIRQLERAILTQLPPAECPVTHHFADGIYGREMFIPAGTVLTGKIHRHSTLNILAQGEIEVTTPQGMRRLVAPAVFVSKPGCKKVGVALTDVVWVNALPTEETDIEKIEAEFIEPEAPLFEITPKRIES